MTIDFKFSHEPKKIDLQRLESFKNIIANPNAQFFHTFERNELIVSSKKMHQHFKDKKIFILCCLVDNNTNLLNE